MVFRASLVLIPIVPSRPLVPAFSSEPVFDSQAVNSIYLTFSIYRALDIIELFFPAALNDWPVLAILRGRISIRPNIQKYIQEGKRQQKVSLSRYETPERVAYLPLKDTPQPRKSDIFRAPSMYSTSETMVMSNSSPKNTLKKKRQPSPFSNGMASPSRRSVGSRMESEESETHHRTPSCSSSKTEDASRKRSIDASEGKRHRSHSFTNFFVKKRSSKTKLQTHSTDSAMADDPKDRNSYKPLDGDNRGGRSAQRAGSGNGSLYVPNTTLNPPFLPVIPKTIAAFPMSGDDVRSSLHSDSLYSNASGPEYNVTVLAI